MIATTIEQSKHLLELGLDPKTADMVYLFEDKEYPCVLKEPDYLDGDDTLAWSLSALLEVMPASVQSRYLKLEKTRITNQWYCDYTYLTDNSCHKNPLDAAYEMVCWLLEQGLICVPEEGGSNESKN